MSRNKLAAQLQEASQNAIRHSQTAQDIVFDVGRRHTKLSLDLIDPNRFQHRSRISSESVNTLAEAIKEVGLLQPITVRTVGARYEIIAGERRFLAHKKLNRTNIEAIIVEASDEDAAMLALVENLQRDNPCDWEIANGIFVVQEKFKTTKDLASAIGINRTDIYSYYAFKALPEEFAAKLNERPYLLGRSAMDDIKKVLVDHNNSETVIKVLRHAWELLEAGKLKQGEVGPWMAAKFTVETKDKTESNDKVSADPICWKTGKTTVAKLEVKKTGLVLKVDAKVLSPNDHEQIQVFISSLLEGRFEP